MVAPHAHVGGLEDLDDTQTADLMRALKRTITVLKNLLEPEGFNIGANIGRVAGAGMPDHVHLHVVPRWNGDTNFMPVLGEVKVVNEHVTQTAAKLSEAFSSS
jgi:ATP adenylyltransferase